MSSGPSSGAAIELERLRSERALPRAWITPAQLTRGALGLTLVAAGALIYHLTRGTTLWFDEWLWVVGRRAGGLGSFLHPYNEHLSLVPIAIYRLLFATAGARDYVPYRLVVIAGHLLCGLLVYVYARRRVGDYAALLGAALILFLGPAWQDIAWPFQIAWTVAIAAGLGALLSLDRRDRPGDALACALIAVSLASTGVGVAIALGIVIEIAVARRRWRDGWIVAFPLALYALWSLAYQHATFATHDVFAAESFAARSAAGSLSALLGLSGTSVLSESGTLLEFGAPLAVAAAAAMIRLAYRRAGWSPRAVTLSAILLAFWLLTAFGRSGISSPYASRYLYVDGVFAVLLAAELARGRAPRWPTRVLLGAAAAAAVVSNIGVLRDGAGYLRAQAPLVKADLGALELSRSLARPDYVATAFPGYPFVVISAGAYFAAERALGSPADSVAQLAIAPEPARELADTEMIHVRGLTLRPNLARPPAGPRPAVDLVSAGNVKPQRSCTTFAAAAAAPGQLSQLQLTVPAAGVWLVASGAQAAVGVRRFADAFQPLGTLPAGAAATLRIALDAARRPWHLQVVTSGSTTACGLAG